MGQSFDEITLESVSGLQVELYRKGTHGYYHGILSCDKRHIIDGSGDWFVNGDRWSGEILLEDNDQFRQRDHYQQ